MIVLDTHAWVWFLGDPARLSAKARTTIEAAMEDGNVLVSSISVWEVAMLHARGRLELAMDLDQWLATAESLPAFRFVPVDNRIAMRSVALPWRHDDAADRIIAATALLAGASLVTKDARLRALPSLATVW